MNWLLGGVSGRFGSASDFMHVTSVAVIRLGKNFIDRVAHIAKF